jgi:hypothetical protein
MCRVSVVPGISVATTTSTCAHARRCSLVRTASPAHAVANGWSLTRRWISGTAWTYVWTHMHVVIASNMLHVTELIAPRLQ